MCVGHGFGCVTLACVVQLVPETRAGFWPVGWVLSESTRGEL
jgi:hypothetical protein